MKIEIPEKLEFLYKPARYKVAYGGRGGAKSQGFGDAVIVHGIQSPKLILCAREFQNSIADSVHSLLAKQIAKIEKNNPEIKGFYEVQKAKIIGKNGTEIIFAGLRHNINNIKSIEAVDICFIEEAQTVSAHTWDVLIPTIRKKGSEIWGAFNPELETDETYRRFVLNPPESAVVVKINWRDNPWFYDTELPNEMEECRERDYDKYLHVWEGHCKQTVEGAVYAKEIRQATLDNRIGKVPVLPGKPIDTFWDLGKHDHTAVWFAQISQGEYRIIDFFENRGEDPAFYLKMLEKKAYLYGTHYLPHDAGHDRMGALSIEMQFRAVYPGKVYVLDRINNIESGIAMTRTIFPMCHFDAENCADGLQSLRRYKYRVDQDTGQYSQKPLHDEASDAADAFRQLAQSLEMRKPKPQFKSVEFSRKSTLRGLEISSGWMES